MMIDTIDNDALQTDAAPVRFAGFGVRLGASLIDALVLLPLIGASTYFTIFSPNFAAYAGIGLLSMLYKPLMEGTLGATLGKMALKLKVVAKEHAPVSLGQGFLRAAPWLIASLLSIYFTYDVFQIPGLEDADGFMEYGQMVGEYQAENGGISSTMQQVVGWLPLVSALVMLGNKRKQSAHDMLAETYVVYRDPVAQSL